MIGKRPSDRWRSITQRSDRSTRAPTAVAVLADDQAAFPVPSDSLVLDLLGPLADHEDRWNAPSGLDWPLRRPLGRARCAGSETARGVARPDPGRTATGRSSCGSPAPSDHQGTSGAVAPRSPEDSTIRRPRCVLDLAPRVIPLLPSSGGERHIELASDR